MGEIIGIPEADRDAIRADNDLLNHCDDGTEQRSGPSMAAGLRLAVYYTSLVKERRRQPADDLVSTLLEARVHGVPLTDEEVVAFLFLMVSVTNESTGKALGSAWYYGGLDPRLRQAGLTGRASDWAAEVLRYDTPTQMVARTLTAETVLHGTTLPAGARIALLLGSANRDETVFADPDVIDLDRDTSAMLTFGRGPHFCLGTALAQLEVGVALDEAGRLVEDYEVDPGRARRVHSAQQRGFAAVPCTVTPRRDAGREPAVP